VKGNEMQLEKGQEAQPRVARVTGASGVQRTPGTANVDASGTLLDYQAAAHYLCTTPRHVRELWARRELAAIKVGRSVRFTKADLDAFVAANRVHAVR
jgi:excisionase family DNA binding protein